MRTPSLMRGYYKNPVATAQAIRERLAPHRRPRLDRRRRLRLHHRADQGRHRHRRRQERLPGRPRSHLRDSPGRARDLRRRREERPHGGSARGAGAVAWIRDDDFRPAATRGKSHRSARCRPWRAIFRAITGCRACTSGASPCRGRRRASSSAMAPRLRAELEAQAAAQQSPASCTARGCAQEEVSSRSCRAFRASRSRARARRPSCSPISGLDSLEAIELLLFLESHFGITVSDARADAIRTVGDVLQLLRREAAADAYGAPPQKLPSQLTHDARTPIRSRLVPRLAPQCGRCTATTSGCGCPPRTAPSPGTRPTSSPANHSSHLDVGAILAAVAGAAGSGEAERLHVLGRARLFLRQHVQELVLQPLLQCRADSPRSHRSSTDCAPPSPFSPSGEPVLIFPEATRSRTGRMQAFKPGLGLLAFESSVPIVPAYIHGTYAGAARRHSGRDGQGAGAFRRADPHDQPRRRIGNKDELYRRIADEVRDAIESARARSRRAGE